MTAAYGDVSVAGGRPIVRIDGGHCGSVEIAVGAAKRRVAAKGLNCHVNRRSCSMRRRADKDGGWIDDFDRVDRHSIEHHIGCDSKACPGERYVGIARRWPVIWSKTDKLGRLRKKPGSADITGIEYAAGDEIIAAA